MNFALVQKSLKRQESCLIYGGAVFFSLSFSLSLGNLFSRFLSFLLRFLSSVEFILNSAKLQRMAVSHLAKILETY